VFRTVRSACPISTEIGGSAVARAVAERQGCAREAARWGSLKAWLKSGELGICPTDTIYGLTGNALDPKVVERAMAAKARMQPMTMVPHSAQWARLLVHREDRERFDVAWDGLRGARTLLFRKDRTAIRLPPPYDATPLIGFRRPSHWISTLASELGVPLLSSSVNRSQEPEMTSLDDLDPRLASAVDFCVYAGSLDGAPSTLVYFDGDGAAAREVPRQRRAKDPS
jgi:L-threonylcarbamoyladenylate synthase